MSCVFSLVNCIGQESEKGTAEQTESVHILAWSVSRNLGSISSCRMKTASVVREIKQHNIYSKRGPCHACE